MLALSLISIALLTAAVVWSVILWRSLANWRVLILTAFFAIILARRILVGANTLGWGEPLPPLAVEWIGTVISGLALLTVIVWHLYIVGRGRAQRQIEFLASALSASADAVLIVDARPLPDGFRIYFVNDSFCRMTGYTREELVGKSTALFCGPSTDKEVIEESVAEVTAGRPSVIEVISSAKGGREYWVELSVAPIRDPRGRTTHYFINQRDITDRKRIDTQLRLADLRYRSITRATGTGFSEVDPHGIIIDANEEFIRLTGRKHPSEVIGHSVLEWTAPHDLERNAIEVAKCAATGHVRGLEIDYIAPDGTIIPVEISAVTIEELGAPRIISFCRDISDRRRADADLRASKERLQLAQSAADIGTFDWDIVGGKVVWQPETERIWGLPRGGFRGTYEHWRELVHPEDLPRAEEIARKALADPAAPFEFEHRIVRPDGTVRWIFAKATTLWEDGKPVRMVGVNMDITERKRAEAALRESEEHFRALVQASSDAVYRMNADWSEMRHLDGRDFIADTNTPSDSWLQKYIHPDDQEQVMAVIKEAIRTKGVFELEHRVLRPDGSLAWTFSRAIPIHDPNGEIVEWFGMASDVTERKLADERIRASEVRLASMVRHTPLAVILWDTSFCIAEWNPAAESIFGWTAEEAIGQHAHFIVPEAARPYVDDIWRGLSSNAGGSRGTNENLTKDARIISCEWYNSPLFGPDAKLQSVVSLCQDVSERVRAEQRQHTLMLELDHRVKNNLAAILALAEQTLYTSDSLQQFGDAFTGRLRAMSRMHELLAHSRWQHIDLRDMVHRSLEAYVIGHKPPITLQGEPLPLPSKIATGLSLVLHELATNASKYGSLSAPTGHVHVDWSVPDAAQETPSNLVINWRETGGPAVTPPQRRGFGTGLIEGVVAYEFGGSVHFDFNPSGLCCRIVIPFVRSGDTAETPSAEHSASS